MTFRLSAILVLSVFALCLKCPAATFESFHNRSYSLINEPDTVTVDTVTADTIIKSFKIESDFNSKYLWHGVDLQDALTWNPNVTYTCKNFSVNVWANLPVHYYNIEDKEEQDFKEIDINLNYEIEKEVSYTMITHSAQIYSPLGQGDWYWGLINVFQGFYKGDIGVYINPEINYYPFKGGMFFETGLNYNHESDKSKVDVYLAHSTANKVFTEYNVSGNEQGTYSRPFQTIKFDVSYQYNLKSVFLRPHFTYFHLLNYADVLGYKNNFSFGMAIGLK
ncbi:MAG: hypothetical protein ABI723_00585 [Bacteroidia bacterium]